MKIKELLKIIEDEKLDDELFVKCYGGGNIFYIGYDNKNLYLTDEKLRIVDKVNKYFSIPNNKWVKS